MPTIGIGAGAASTARCSCGTTCSACTRAARRASSSATRRSPTRSATRARAVRRRRPQRRVPGGAAHLRDPGRGARAVRGVGGEAAVALVEGTGAVAVAPDLASARHGRHRSHDPRRLWRRDPLAIVVTLAVAVSTRSAAPSTPLDWRSSRRRWLLIVAVVLVALLAATIWFTPYGKSTPAERPGRDGRRPAVLLARLTATRPRRPARRLRHPLAGRQPRVRRLPGSRADRADPGRPRQELDARPHVPTGTGVYTDPVPRVLRRRR